MNDKIKTGVVGAGSWGTALAHLLCINGHDVSLWCREKEVAESIKTKNENTIFLPGQKLCPNLLPTNILEECVSGKEMVLIVVPSEWFRETAGLISSYIHAGAIIVSATKGIEIGTRQTMSSILVEELKGIPPEHICAISGPSFAKEVVDGQPTVVTVACLDRNVAKGVQKIFASPFFRVYTNSDLIGVELGGAVKNVMAIASGVCDGLGLGANTRTALITRGLAEIRRLGLALGAMPRTFTGLAGMGDLVLTCTTHLSRNYSVGVKLGKGMKLASILAEMRMVAEGVRNARSVYNLSLESGVEMPIVQATYSILYEDLDPREAVMTLMTRSLREELDEL